MSTDNVDTKVVSLEFDNKQFEAGVKTSMSTLEKLKESLNFAKNTDSLKGLQDSVKHFDTSHLSNSIQQVNASWSAMQTIGDQVLRNLTNSVMHFGTKMIHTVTSSITQGGWRRAINIEQAKFQIEGLGHAWDEYADAIDYAVSGTAYGLDAAAKAASQFLATGVTDPSKMGKYLRGISGVAAMSGRDYDSIANIFTKIAGQGRVMGDELNQLAASGINAAATMAKQWGITEAEVRELVHEGKVSFKDFAEAMDDAFGEHAKDANKTFTGALSNMKAALARIGAKVATPLLNNLRDLFNWLRVAINQASKALDPFINGLNKVQDIITERLDVLITGSDRGRSLIHFKDQMEETFGKDTQSVMKDFEAELKTIVGEDNYKWWIKQSGSFEKALHNGMASADQISQAFANMADSEKYSSEEMQKQQLALRNMSKDATSIGSSLNRWLTDMGKISKYSALDRVLDSWRDLGYTYKKDILPALIDAGNARGVDVEKIIKDYGGIREAVRFGAIDAEVFKDAFTNLGKEGSNAAKALAWELSDTNSELGALVERLDDRPTLYYIGEIISNIVNMLGKPIKMIVEAFHEVFSGSLFDSLNEILDWASDITAELQLSDDLLAGIKSLVKGVLSIIKSAGGIIYRVLTLPTMIIKNLLKGFMSVFDAGTSLFSWFASGVGTVLQDLARWIDSFKIIEGITNIISDLFYRVGKLVGDIVLKIKGSERLQKFVKSIKDSVWNIYNAIKNIFRAINIDNLFSVLSSIGDVIANIVEMLLNSTVFQRSIEIIAELIVRIIDGISHAAEAIKTFFDSIKTRFPTLSKMKDVGTSMWKGLIEGFDASGVLNAVGAFFEKLIDFVCDILGIHSPSLVFYTIGTFIVLGLINGIVDKSGALRNVITNLFNLDGDMLADVTGSFGYWFDQVLDVISQLAQNFIDHLKNIDLGSIIAGSGFLIGARWLYALPGLIADFTTPISTALDSFAKFAQTFAAGTANVFNAVQTFINTLSDTLRDFSKRLTRGFNMRALAKLILSVAALLLVLVGTVYLFSTMDKNALNDALIHLGKIVIILSLLIAALAMLVRSSDGQFNRAIKIIGAVSGMILALVTALMVYVFAVKRLKGLTREDIASVYAALLPFGLLVGAVLVILKKGTPKRIKEATLLFAAVSGMIGAMSGMLLAMALAFKIVGGMGWESWIKAIGAFVVVFGALFGLVAYMKHNKMQPAEVLNLFTSLGSILLVVGVMALVVFALTFISRLGLGPAVGAVIMLGALMFALVVFYKQLAKIDKFIKVNDAKRIAKSLMPMVAVLLALAGVLFVLTLIVALNPWAAAGGLIGLSIMMFALYEFYKGLSKMSEKMKTSTKLVSIAKGLLPIAGAIAILALIALIVSKVSFGTAVIGMVNLLPFALLILGLVWALAGLTKKFNFKEMVKINHTLLYVVAAIGMLALLAIMISMLNPKDISKGIAVIGSMGLLMIGIIFAMGYLSKHFTFDTNLGKIKSLLILVTVIIGALAGILYLCAEFTDTKAMVRAAVAIAIMAGILVIMFAGLAFMAKVVKRKDSMAKLLDRMKQVLAVLPLLGVVMLALVGLVAIMSFIPNTDGLIEKAIAIAVLAGVMVVVGGALALISKIPGFTPSALAKTALAFGVVVVVMAALIGLLYLIDSIPPTSVFTLGLLATVTVMLVVVGLGFAALGALAGVVAIGGGMFIVITALITGVAYILGWLDKLAGFRDRVTRGFEVLKLIAEGIGEAIGAFFYGIYAGVGDQDWSWLEKLQAALEPFMEFASKFSAADVEGVQAMADVIEQISDIGYINSLTTSYGGTSGIDDFAQAMPKLARALKNFSDILGDGFKKDVVADAATSIGTLADAYVNIASTTGSQDITKFTSNMPNLATALTEFADSVSEFKMTEGLQTSLDTLTNLSTTMPILTEIGNYKMNNFADSMTQLGTGLKNFADEISNIDEGAENSPAVKLAQTLVELSQTLGGASGDDMGLGIVGSLANLLMGSDGDLGKFGKQCKDLGAGLAAYAEAAGQIPDSFNENKGAVAVKLAQNLIELGKATGNANGLIMIPMLSTMMGNTDASDAVSRVKALGEVLVAFAGSLSEMPETLPSGLDKLVDVVKLMGMDWPDEIPNITPSESLNLKLFSSTLKTYAENLSGDALTVITDSGPALQSFAKGLGAISNVDSDKIANAINAVKAVNSKSVVESATNLVSSFGNAMSSASSSQSTGMAEAGTNMAKSMSDGFGKASSKYMKGAADNTAISAIGAFKSQLSKFTDAGISAGQGFANGLRSTLPSTEAAASSLSSGAINKLKKLLDIKSPSRVLFGLGAYAGQGFVNGFISYKNAVDLAAQNMGNTLVDSVNDTLSAIGKDMSPVISPIMDLSNVSRGTAAISNMLDQAMTNSALGNIGGITNAMYRNSNRASNDDVVTAVNALRDDVSALATNTTTIGDITLDGSGEVMAAVETLARYATLERRSSNGGNA